MKANNLILLFCGTAALLSSCNNTPYGKPVAQTPIDRIELMPNKPEPYKMLDWHQKAVDFDKYAFEFNTRICGYPVIWLDR